MGDVGATNSLTMETTSNGPVSVAELEFSPDLCGTFVGEKHQGFSRRQGSVRCFDAGVKILMHGHQMPN